MNRIQNKIAEVKEQFKVGLISKVEMEQMIRALNIELMGCDSL